MNDPVAIVTKAMCIAVMLFLCAFETVGPGTPWMVWPFGIITVGMIVAPLRWFR